MGKEIDATLFSKSNLDQISQEEALRAWAKETARSDWNQSLFHQTMTCHRMTPKALDGLLADGWRHFGSFFFRDIFNIHERKLVRVLPLRIVLDHFDLAKDQKRILKKNTDLMIEYGPVQIDEEHLSLFEKHKIRFNQNPPESLYVYFDQDHVGTVPNPIWQCAVYMETIMGKRLIAVSYFDLGEESLSSIFATFDPECESRSLGTFTLLMEVLFAQQHHKKYVYTGYSYKTPSHYDYKKRFKGSEFYDYIDSWHPLEIVDDFPFRIHSAEGKKLSGY